MCTRWKNIYPGNNSGVHIASDNPDDIHQLVESLLKIIGAWDSRITRTGALAALAIAEKMLLSLEDPVKEYDRFGDDNYQDIDSDSFTIDLSSRAFRQ